VKPSRDELRARLEQVSAPDPRPDFVARLAVRLRSIDPGAHDLGDDPGLRRPRAGPGFVALGAAAFILAVLLALLPAGDRQIEVTGTPSATQPDEGEGGARIAPSSTTSTTVRSTETTLAESRPGATVSPADRSGPSPGVPDLSRDPGVKDRPTSTTRPAPPPTTTKPTTEPLALTCAAGRPEGQPGVRCDWSQSTAPAFAAYRLWRATGTEAKQVLTTIPNREVTSFVDRPTAGVHHYMVEALDAQNRVVGRSRVVEAVCC
jgi:hypothetical protein